MSAQPSPSNPPGATAKAASALGFYSSIVAAVLTLVTFTIAFLTPPLSGPGCTSGCFTYPYTDIVSRFPRDYGWMYPAIVLSLVYFVLVVCIHHFAPQEKKVYTHVGLSFALISASVLILDYFMQVSIVQPSLLNGETEGIPLLTQFNPHGIFIVLEEAGFFMMSLAFLFLAPAFSGPGRLERAIRWIFVLAFVLTVIALVIVSLQFGIFREYWFEIAAISINWLALLVSGILLSVLFRRAMRGS